MHHEEGASEGNRDENSDSLMASEVGSDTAGNAILRDLAAIETEERRLSARVRWLTQEIVIRTPHDLEFPYLSIELTRITELEFPAVAARREALLEEILSTILFPAMA